MNGPEHYLEAERLLGLAADAEPGSGVEQFRLTAAQVHATLAMAAAVGLLDDRNGALSRPSCDVVGWDQATYGNAAGHR